MSRCLGREPVLPSHVSARVRPRPQRAKWQRPSRFLAPGLLYAEDREDGLNHRAGPGSMAALPPWKLCVCVRVRVRVCTCGCQAPATPGGDESGVPSEAGPNMNAPTWAQATLRCCRKRCTGLGGPMDEGQAGWDPCRCPASNRQGRIVRGKEACRPVLGNAGKAHTREH